MTFLVIKIILMFQFLVLSYLFYFHLIQNQSFIYSIDGGSFICVLPTELFSFLRPIKLNSLCGDLDFEFSQVRGDTELGVVPLLFNPFVLLNNDNIFIFVFFIIILAAINHTALNNIARANLLLQAIYPFLQVCMFFSPNSSKVFHKNSLDNNCCCVNPSISKPILPKPFHRP